MTDWWDVLQSIQTNSSKKNYFQCAGHGDCYFFLQKHVIVLKSRIKRSYIRNKWDLFQGL